MKYQHGRQSLSGPAAVNIQSITKTFVAALALSLVEQEQLSLSDTPQNILVEAPHTSEVFGLERLLAHTSGLGFAFLPGFETGTPTALAANFARTELKVWYPADALHSYVNTGFVLAAHTIEQQTGRPYEALMQEQVFGPLGLDSTTFDPASRPDLSFATLHAAARFGERKVPATKWAASERPAGGIYTSAEDLARFAQALMQPGLLSPDTLQSMRRSRGAPGEPSQLYGLGLVVEERAGFTVYSHGGGVPGGNSNMVFVPQLGLVAVAMLTDLNLSAAQITDRALSSFGQVPARQINRNADASLWPSFAGRYIDNHWMGNLRFATSPGTMTVTFEDGQITQGVRWWGPRNVAFDAPARLQQSLGVNEVFGTFIVGNDGESYLVTRIGVPQKQP